MTERNTLLAQIQLFESLVQEDLTALSDRLSHRTVAEGETIFRQGEPGATLYVVQSGAVELSIGEETTHVVVATLHPGQHFGELSLLDGSPRSATARAMAPTTLLALDREDFTEFLQKSPKSAVSILAEMGERLRQTNELMSRQVARNVLEEEAEKLTLGQRVADRVAAFGGSWPFIFLFGGMMSVWMTINAILGERGAFDPYPFILLNLMLSTLAALQAPVIMMSQNRQSTKDKALAENDYQVNLKAERGIETLLRKQSEILVRLAQIERSQGVMSVKGGGKPE